MEFLYKAARVKPSGFLSIVSLFIKGECLWEVITITAKNTENGARKYYIATNIYVKNAYALARKLQQLMHII